MLIKAYMQDRERLLATIPVVPDTMHSNNPRNPPNPPSGSGGSTLSTIAPVPGCGSLKVCSCIYYIFVDI